jgi:hypothetical protein
VTVTPDAAGATVTTGTLFGTAPDRYYTSCSVAGVHVGPDPVFWEVRSSADDGVDLKLSLAKVDAPPAPAPVEGGGEGDEAETRPADPSEAHQDSAPLLSQRAPSGVGLAEGGAPAVKGAEEDGPAYGEEDYVLVDSHQFTLGGLKTFFTGKSSSPLNATRDTGAVTDKDVIEGQPAVIGEE